MSLPGTTIISRDTPPPVSAPTDSGVWFVAGLTDKGKATPIRVKSLDEFVEKLGDRQSYSTLYDAVDAYFREGGSTLYVSRVLGPTPVTASVTLDDNAAAATMTVKANSPGQWGNSLNVEITAGESAGEFKVVVSHDTDASVAETSHSLVDVDEAIAWAAGSSKYIEIEDDATSALDPDVVAATSLTGGDDDRTNVTDTHWSDALDQFVKDLGPGQVSFPGRTAAQGITDLLAHAAENNRFAVVDTTDSAVVATLTAEAATHRPSVNARYGMMVTPWVEVPGLTPNTVRDVPYSAIQAGLMARSDGLGNSANVPAAGDNGVSRYALRVKNEWTDADRETLNVAGVNVARALYGAVKTYGYRTLVDPNSSAAAWLMANNSRMYMKVAAEAAVIAEHYVLTMIDGRRRTISQFGGELTGMLLPYWQDGSLFGDTAEEAFLVDVGASVNTDTTIAAGELRAVIAMKLAPFAERVTIELVKVATTEAVA